MNVLLTGANGYIGKRLAIHLVDAGANVFCLVRDKNRLNLPDSIMEKVSILEGDFLVSKSLPKVPVKIDAAYYLIHSMKSGSDFDTLESRAAKNFVSFANKSQFRQVIYLSGLVNDEDLSKHLSSRKRVEDILGEGKFHLTTLRAGIIIGSGSASFEILRDLVEKLPVMVAPKWVSNKCQPISITNVIEYLAGVLGNEACFDQHFDIGGTEQISYKDMMLQYADTRGLNRWIISVPVLTPNLSSLWLYFITSTSFPLARHLVDSLKNNAVCKENRIREIVPIELISFKTSIKKAFDKIEQNTVISSWVDAFSMGIHKRKIHDLIEVPEWGCFKDLQAFPFQPQNRQQILDNVWKIGGSTGWYYGDFLWQIRGFLDKLFGGVGLRRGRRSPIHLTAGDSLDFWRVLMADRKNGRLLLYAEMKLPGEAWLEFKVEANKVRQTATFRPIGVWGRLYWFLMLPFHEFIFKNMVKEICEDIPVKLMPHSKPANAA